MIFVKIEHVTLMLSCSFLSNVTRKILNLSKPKPLGNKVLEKN